MARLRTFSRPQPRLKYHAGNRILVYLGIRRHVELGQIQQLPWTPRNKYLLIAMLLIVGIVLTPSVLLRRLGSDWGKLDQLCKGGDEKLKRLKQNLEEEVSLQEAMEQEVEATLILRWAEGITVNGTFSSDDEPLYEDFPNGCDELKVQQAIDAAMGRRCEERVCVDDSLLSILCKTITIPCPNPDALEASRVWAEYKRYQELKALPESEPRETRTVPPVTPEAEGLINKTLRQIDFASAAYNFYLVVVLSLAAPVSVYKASLRSRVLGSAAAASKPVWILLVILVWNLIDVSQSAALKVWWARFVADPCYVDPDFNAAKARAVAETCNRVAALARSYADKQYQVMDIQATAASYAACFADSWRERGLGFSTHPADVSGQVEWTSINDFDLFEANERLSFQTAQSTLSANFTSTCDPKQLSDLVAFPPEGLNLLRLILTTGIIAQLLFAPMLTTWLYNLFGYLDPWCTCNGQVEVYGNELDEEDQETVRQFRRDVHRVPLLLTSIVIPFLIGMLIYSSIDVGSL